MSVECNLIISILKLTKKGPVLTENVNKDAHVPTSTAKKLLQKMQNEGLLYLKQDSVEVENKGRLKLAVQAASLGADLEHISNLLCWQEFEEITAFALKDNGYAVLSNVRFKNAARRWEIDVVGCKKPLVICIDCKHWQHAIAPAALKRIVNSQVERTAALANSLPNIALKLECTKWREAKFIPAILSLIPSSFKFFYEVPIVPVLQLQDFINQLPVYTESLKYFTKKFNSLSHNF
jgi:Holliday junction resolvase-like predicted endonuclease/predicted transcriptional regulator